MLLFGQVRRGAESIEIGLDAFSAETSVFLARAEVAGRAETRGDLEGLVRLLALRLVQQFPECAGQVLSRRGDDVTCNLGARDLLRESMKLTVFRFGAPLVDPVTAEPLGRTTEKLSEALVRSVRRRTSTAGLTEGAPEEAGEIEAGDRVATK